MSMYYIPAESDTVQGSKAKSTGNTAMNGIFAKKAEVLATGY